MQEPSSTRVQELVARLRAAGHRLTPQRLAILCSLARGDAHPSAEAIFAEVRALHPMVSLATVYNTIETLKEMGEVLELQFSTGNRYDGRLATPHPHLVCTHCGRIEDVALPALQSAVDAAARHLPFTAAVPRLDFYGICPACRETAPLQNR
jgi:Fur family peroxide stress response transcriptional regulator